MKVIKLLSVVLCAMVMATQVQANIFNVAQDRTEVLLDETHFKGENLVRIKAQINQKLQAQGMKAKDFKLVGVTLRAKSKKGKGRATLIVGQDQETRKVRKSKAGGFGDLFGGDLGSFLGEIGWADKGGNTFHKIEWDLTGAPGMSSERWQIRFNGNIKVDFMEVHLQSSLTKVRIRMGSEIYGTAGNAVSDKIRLKASLKNAGYQPKRYKLRAVRVRTKSKGGKGKASLVVANNVVKTKNVLKAPQGNFQATQGNTFNKVDFRGLQAAQGNWQIHFRGRNRVKNVVLILEEK
ncbi:MAG: hypothetical protein MJK18_03135 [Bdellovibrionales bacterium]|nr:hypothetical protein [Bdellovibrionales bacterium]